MGKLLRRVTGVILVIMLVIPAAGAGLYFWLRTTLPDIDGTIGVEGISGSVDILRDEWGIPHIHAGSPEDAYFGLGYAHAQDRFFQMEMQRRGAQGRVAELLGSLAADNDRFLRLLDLYRAARSSVASLPPEARAALEAYAAGVNAWLATRTGPPAPELALLLANEPEPWHPADSVSWLKVMALMLSGNWREEALHAALVQRLGPEKAASFLPPSPDSDTTVIDLEEGIDFAAFAAFFARHLPDANNGSNNWAVSGSHTISGFPIAANDPHLGFTIPSVWYLAHMAAPGLNVAGATLPGMPFVLVGTNGAIAWTLSNTGPDTQDLFVEVRDPDNPDRYMTPAGSAPFAVRDETIAVRFSRNQHVTMLETRHGPVLTGMVRYLDGDTDDDEVLSLAWTMLHDDDQSVNASLLLHTAENWQAFNNAGRSFAGPMQNIIYADRDGSIGVLSPGFVPVRRSGDGRLPVDGSSGEADWAGRIPFDDLPRVVDPPSGIIVAANNRPVGKDYPYFLSHRWEPEWRAQRIHDVLDTGTRLDPATFYRLQLDTWSGLASALVPHALTSKPQTTAGRLLQIHLENWDYSMDADHIAPTIFHTWYRALTRAIYADELGELFERAWRDRPLFVLATLGDDVHGWCNDTLTGETLTCAEVSGRALDEAADTLVRSHGSDPSGWVWGDIHAMHLRHPLFGLVPILDSLTGVSIPLGGDGYSVFATSYRIASGRDHFNTFHGPSLRAVIDLDDPVTGHFVTMPGQSGNPFSPYYDNLVERWHVNQPVAIIPGSRIAEAAHHLILAPASLTTP